MSAREKNLKRYPWKRKSGREKWVWNSHFAREKMQKKVQNRFSCPLSFPRQKKKHWAQIVHVKKEFQHVKILRNMPVKMIFVRVKKYQKKPVSARENDNLGVKKVKKVRKSGRETLTLHVKKCKKRSKIGFHAHFRFHGKKKTLPPIMPLKTQKEKKQRVK